MKNIPGMKILVKRKGRGREGKEACVTLVILFGRFIPMIPKPYQ